MFTNISWSNYILVVIILLGVWYLFISIKFYAHDLQNFMARIWKRTPPDDNDEFSNEERKVINTAKSPSEQDETSETDTQFEEGEELKTKLKEAIADASFKNYNKQEFTYLLQKTLKAYPQIKGSLLQATINKLIISDSGKYGSLHLSTEDLEMLWKGVA